MSNIVREDVKFMLEFWRFLVLLEYFEESVV